ncbi:MAG TPA: polysaccharide deacetylase family protein [Polyangia bacterium]|nr:polysaccharide deacetylase family protein [Polyangia bacterium]
MKVSITVDVEHDCPPFLETYRGIEEGMPRLLALLAEENVRGTFFTTGDVARRYPGVVRALVAAGHELGCHGDTHRRFSDLDEHEARREIEDASRTLREHAEVHSFRAPNLDFPSRYLPILKRAQFRFDSSEGRHKPGSFFKAPTVEGGLVRIPASTAPSVVRLPRLIRERVLARMASPVVLFFHPWEFVDLTRAPIPLDCRFRTGEPALADLRAAIRFFASRGATFSRLDDLAAAA